MMPFYHSREMNFHLSTDCYKVDHQQIHTKWVTDYNIECIEHLAFVINGENIWAHWGVLCPNTNLLMSMTQVAFAIVV
jgi:hypothetical protein